MPPARTLVALATYNERENLPSLVDAVFEAVPEAEVLVVDDASPDGTGEWCDARAATERRLRCLHRAGKLGLGSATIDAMRVAVNERYDAFVTLDADWSHDPRHLPELIAGLELADVAIGSRYCLGGSIEGWPFTRRVTSRIVNAASRRFLRLPVRDASGAYRAYRVSALSQLALEQIRSQGYAYLEEILWQLRRHGATFLEVPITFRDRRGGASKATWREAIGKIVMIGRLMFR